MCKTSSATPAPARAAARTCAWEWLRACVCTVQLPGAAELTRPPPPRLVASIRLYNVLHAYATASCKDTALGSLRLALHKLAVGLAEAGGFLGNAATRRGKADELAAVAELGVEAHKKGQWMGPGCSMASADGTFWSTADGLCAKVVRRGVARLSAFETKQDESGRLTTADGELKLPERHNMQAFMHVYVLEAQVVRWNRQLADGTPLRDMPAGLVTYLSEHGVTKLEAARHCSYRVSQSGT